SVAGYRGKEKNEREIGRTLGVSYVLEGSVQKAGDRVRVHAQLIDTRTLTEVWAQQYDRKVDDLFVVESDLAQAIASQLRGQLTAPLRANAGRTQRGYILERGQRRVCKSGRINGATGWTLEGCNSRWRDSGGARSTKPFCNQRARRKLPRGSPI